MNPLNTEPNPVNPKPLIKNPFGHLGTPERKPHRNGIFLESLKRSSNGALELADVGSSSFAQGSARWRGGQVG